MILSPRARSHIPSSGYTLYLSSTSPPHASDISSKGWLVALGFKSCHTTIGRYGCHGISSLEYTIAQQVLAQAVADKYHGVAFHFRLVHFLPLIIRSRLSAVVPHYARSKLTYKQRNNAPHASPLKSHCISHLVAATEANLITHSRRSDVTK
jgi:hypothetical protein